MLCSSKPQLQGALSESEGRAASSHPYEALSSRRIGTFIHSHAENYENKQFHKSVCQR